MRIIREANSKIAKLWGAGKIQSADYRLLTYVIPAEVENGTLLHNAITGELIFLDAGEVDRLSGLPCAYAPWMDELIQKHFLVRAESDDKKTADDLHLALKVSEASGDITRYTILPTTNCNARCFYCYEAGCKHENMSDETADKLVAFIDAHRGGKDLHIGWFGGEPLVGLHQIDRICKALRERNILFFSSMISNGYLFDEEIVKRAKEEWKLNEIQITLDGTEKIYNETKSYTNPCVSPYQRVLDNIGFLMNHKIHVSVRMNLGMHNYDDLSRLIDELGMRFEDKTYLGAYTDILFENCGFEPTRFSEEQLDLLFAKKDALEHQIHSYAQGAALGKLPNLIAYSCMTDRPSDVVVTPSGMLSKCEHYLDSKFVGSLDTGITNQQEIKSYAEKAMFPECDNCPMYPACIKLKVCQKNTCSKRLAQEKQMETAWAMKRYYEEYLRNGFLDGTERHEEPNC